MSKPVRRRRRHNRKQRKLGMKTFVVLITTAVLASVAMAALSLKQQLSINNPVDLIQNVSTSPTPTPATLTPSTATPAGPSQNTQLPDTITLSVPYTLQAPYAVFDAVHEDACEETSLIMIKHFLDGTPIGDKAAADKEIIDLVHYGESIGQGPSITLDQLNQLAQSYYHISGTVKQAHSMDDIKAEIAAGHPVILPLAGKVLGNPYFSNGGPVYHMLVAKGYDTTGFIMNEPGTWHGEGYHYDYSVIQNALHDWNPTDIMLGQADYLVFN